MCHPPVGLNLYVASGITKMGITELTVAVWPWLLTMLVFLVIVTYWPGVLALAAARAGDAAMKRLALARRVAAVSLATPRIGGLSGPSGQGDRALCGRRTGRRHGAAHLQQVGAAARPVVPDRQPGRRRW